jgi:hypothetical protein
MQLMVGRPGSEWAGGGAGARGVGWSVVMGWGRGEFGWRCVQCTRSSSNQTEVSSAHVGVLIREKTGGVGGGQLGSHAGRWSCRRSLQSDRQSGSQADGHVVGQTVISFFIYTQLLMCPGRVHDPTSQFSSQPLFVCKFGRQGGTEAF